MRRARFLFLFIFAAYGLSLQATENASVESNLEESNLQFSFVTPLGTNSDNSWNVINKFSFNFLTGYSGGNNGLEISGLGSTLRTDMKGTQFSGVGNVVCGNSHGAQFAGIANVVLRDMKGTQFSLANNIAREVKGAQFSVVNNIARDSLSGAQFSGINIVLKDMRGMQAGVVANVVTGSSRGLQMASAANVVTGNMKGTQFAGGANVVIGSSRGLQGALGGNAVIGDLEGVQFAGVANFVRGDSHGVQAAAINYSKNLTGLQFGVINYAESADDGLPIGLLSIVKNGYRAWEMAGNESIYGTTSFKLGVRKFYTIFSTGGGYRNDRSLFAWGAGFGGHIPLANQLDVALETQAFHVNEGEWFTVGTNMLGRVSASLSWAIADHFTLFAGPSWNVAISNIKKEKGSSIAPWTVLDKTTAGGVNVKMYPGVMVGFRV